jgi:hypothetical protein
MLPLPSTRAASSATVGVSVAATARSYIKAHEQAQSAPNTIRQKRYLLADLLCLPLLNYAKRSMRGARKIRKGSPTLMAEIEISDAAAAYGEFNLAFAALETELARSLVLLNDEGNFWNAFRKVRWWKFIQKVEALRKITAVFQNGVEDSSVSLINDALQQSVIVADWRNDRIHGDVWLVNGFVVVLGRDGKPVQIDAIECSKMRHNAILALCNIQTNVDRLVAARNVDREMERDLDRLFAEMEQSRSEGEDHEEDA